MNTKTITTILKTLATKFDTSNLNPFDRIERDLNCTFSDDAYFLRNNQFELSYNKKTKQLELETIYSNQAINQEFVDNCNFLFNIASYFNNTKNDFVD